MELQHLAKYLVVLHILSSCVLLTDLPRITYHTPDQSCKEGDQVKLQCNGTGYPVPQFEWEQEDINEIIANSSVTSVNIKGKRSEGSYCCHLTNQFGKTTNCTAVLVTEYGPVNTKLWPSIENVTRNQTFEIRCTANASPPPKFFLMEINSKQFNLSTGVLNFTLDDDSSNVAISCIPYNEYGGGPIYKDILPVNVMTDDECKNCPTPDFGSAQNEQPTGLIIGFLIAGVLIVILLVSIFCCYKKRPECLRNDTEAKKKQEPTTSTSHLVQLPISDEEEKLQTKYYIHLITRQFPGQQILLENDQGESSFSTLSSVESSLLDYHTEKLS